MGWGTTPIDIVDYNDRWLLSYRYEPFLDRWFVVRPNAAASLELVEESDVPEKVRASAPSRSKWGPHGGAYFAPTKIQIQLNRHCNYGCSICYANSYRGRAAQDDFTIAQLTNLFDYMKAWGVCRINFVGGEVFMRQDFIEIVEAAQKRRLLVSCITNGRIPGAKIDEYRNLLHSLFNVQISCNGIGKSYEDEYATDSWDKASASIANVIAATKANTLSYVVSDNNCDDIPAFIEFARKVRPNIIKFGSVCWSGRSETSRAVTYYRECLPRAKAYIGEARRTYPDLQIQSQLDLGCDTPLWEDYAHGYRPFEFYFAPEGRDGVYVAANGDIYPFPLLSDRPEFKIGNVHMDNLQEIWARHPLLERLRQVTFENSDCGRLGCNKVCGLWSRSYAIAWSDRLDGKVPCQLTGWETRSVEHPL